MVESLYIHVPFCVERCHYCSFYSTKADDPAKADAYRLALLCEIEQAAAAGTMADTLDTVYFGGGNPCFDGGRTVAAVLSMPCIRSRIQAGTEVSAECNPESADTCTMEILIAAGVNRLSMGLQTTDDGLLAAIGRRHTYEDFLQALACAQIAGFSNISADLIYGLPGQTVDEWHTDLNRIVKLELQHISCYALKIEEESRLYDMICSGQLLAPDDDLQAEMFDVASEFLQANGYGHYEISNFAKKNKRSRHNLVYWQGGDYLGFGPSAHSRIGRQRFWNQSSLEKYNCRTMAGENIRQYIDLSMSDWIMETAMMMLRTSQGIENETFARLFGVNPISVVNEKIRTYMDDGLIDCDRRGIRLNERGFLLSNRILAEILTFSYKLDS